MRIHLLLLTGVSFITWVGARITAVALPLAALAATGQPWTAGLVGGVAGIPLLTVGWWGIHLRERLTSGRSLAAVTLMNAAGLLVVPLVSSLGHLNALWLCVSGIITGVASALSGPAERSLISDLADLTDSPRGRPSAPRWLAWQDLAQRVSMIFAPPLGAWLLTLWGTEPLLWCESLVVAASSLALLPIPKAPTIENGTGPSRGRNMREPSPSPSSASAIDVLRAHPSIGAGVFMAGVGGVCWFAFTLGLAILGVEHGTPGVLIAAGMAGYGTASVLASLISPLTVQRLPKVLTMAIAWTILGAVFLSLPLAVPEIVPVTVLAACGGAAMPFAIAALNAAISSETTGSERRAAFTSETVLHSGGASVGLLVGGAIIGLAGAGPTLATAGALQIIAALLGVLWDRRGSGTRGSKGKYSRPSGTRPRDATPARNRQHLS